MVIAEQLTLDGDVELVVAEPPKGDVVQRLALILEQSPQARNSYRAMMLHYWAQYQGLADLLGDMFPAFCAWFMQVAESTKTLQNRGMELQRKRNDLRPSQRVQELRSRQSRQGPIR